MIKDMFNAFKAATRRLLQSWRALLIMLALYLAMIGSVYLFFSTREATIGQVVVTFALGILAPFLWLVIQGMAVGYASEDRAGKLLVRSLADFWKLALIAIPLFLVVGLAVYYLGSVESKLMQETVRSVAAPRRLPLARVPAVRSAPWQAIALSTLQYLLLLLVLPLALIHLRIDAASTGLKTAFKRFPVTFAKAFAPRSVLVYAIGFVLFAIVPYFLITRRTPVTSPWLDVSLLGVRLTLAVLFSLIGWVVTVAALTRLATGKPAAAEELDNRRFNQGTEHVPAES
jgi:hypothetical protein